MIQARGNTSRSFIHKLIHFIWDNSSGRNLLLHLFIKNVDKTDCSNCRGISLLPNTYKIYVSRLTPYVDEIIGYHQRGFQCIIRTTDQICIRYILEKKWEHNGTVHLLFIDSEKSCNSVRKEVKVKVSLTKHHAMKTYRGSGSIAPPILDLGTRRR
jgi:hypothetical protein